VAYQSIRNALLSDGPLAATLIAAVFLDAWIAALLLGATFVWIRLNRKAKLPWWCDLLLVIGAACLALTKFASLQPQYQRWVDVCLLGALVALLGFTAYHLAVGVVSANRDGRRIRAEMESLKATRAPSP